MKILIYVPGRKAIFIFGIAILIMLSLSLFFGFLVAQGADQEIIVKLNILFNVDEERNLPTWLSSNLILMNGLIIIQIAYYKRIAKQAYFWHWMVLGLLFLWLSFDEFAQLHEKLIEPVRYVLDTSGYFYNAWVIPVGILVFFLGIMYLPFLFHLTPVIRRYFIISTLLYLAGAIGIEILGSPYREYLDQQGLYNDVNYLLITHVEEILEIVGMSLFLYIQTRYFQNLTLHQ